MGVKQGSQKEQKGPLNTKLVLHLKIFTFIQYFIRHWMIIYELLTVSKLLCKCHDDLMFCESPIHKLPLWLKRKEKMRLKQKEL